MKKSFNIVMLRRDYKHNDKTFEIFFVNTRKNDAKIKITRINLERTSLRQDSTVAVVTATAVMGQRGRTVYFRLWLSSCSLGGPLTRGAEFYLCPIP